MTKYIFFYGGFLSNWYAAEFTYKGHEFANSEQAFMWEKAILFSDNEIANKILKTSDPRKVKALGRKVKNFDSITWDDHKYNLMVDVNYEKYKQNPDMLEKLLKTGDSEIVEASPFDKIWGIGLDEEQAIKTDPQNWPGQNLLGLVLMELRLKFETNSEASQSLMDEYHDYILNKKPVSKEKQIAFSIMEDVTDRRGWRQEWDQFDDDIKEEIFQRWIDIAKEKL